MSTKTPENARPVGEVPIPGTGRTVRRVDPATDPKPWIERPETIRKLWIVAGIVLTGLVAADLVVHHHAPVFGIEGTFGFSAGYGFLACVAMVIVSKKVIGLVLSRKDTFYDE
jgi:hypothetical protein